MTAALKTIAVHAYAIAETVPLKKVESVLVESLAAVRVGKTHAVFSWGDERYVVVHDFGAVVFFGIAEPERRDLMSKVVAIVGAQPSPAFEESFAIAVDPNAAASSGFDRVVVPALRVEVVELVALVIGQSAAMEYYEDDVDKILERLDRLSADLAESGRPTFTIRHLTRFTGEAMRLRGRVVLTLALLDAPLATWNDESLDRVYGQLRTSFAIDDRYRALDDKLEMVRDHLGIIVDLTVQKRSHFLEIVVVILIAVEVVLYVFLK